MSKELGEFLDNVRKRVAAKRPELNELMGVYLLTKEERDNLLRGYCDNDND